MASFEDYDEFGNYIGADLDSDDDEEVSHNAYAHQQRTPPVQPLEGFDEDQPMTGVEDGALMQVDGMS
jgi:116 kDa U5 small nuclear ribonucleoprotein component